MGWSLASGSVYPRNPTKKTGTSPRRLWSMMVSTLLESAVQTLQADDYMPYAPAKPVLDIVRRIRERSLPEVLSRKELQRLGAAEGNSDRIQKALQFLDLIDQSGKRTANFDRIGKASTSEYPLVFAEIVRAAYARILAIVDPRADTDIAINDAFRHYEPAGQRSQMVGLFMALCREAGLADAAAPQRRALVRKEATASAAPPRRRNERKEKVVERDQDSSVSDDAPGSDYRLLSALIQQLPRDGKWTGTRRDRWLQAFTANIDLLVEVVEPAADE
jgi:Family of unknown function (DUF5343)